jgi:DNA-binding response OmpR family regulator
MESSMPRALIIEDNMAISSAVRDRLAELGFDSFEQSWTEDQAVAAAERHHPDLVVVGDTLISGSPIEAARRISLNADVTVMAVTADGAALARRLPPSTTLHGPYSVTEIEAAVDDAMHVAPAFFVAPV